MTSNSGTAQTQAFSYLRDKVRRAHLDGDGLRVNSLCALALAQICELASGHRLQMSVQQLRWAFIFPNVWLIDDYMLHTLKEGLDGFPKDCRTPEEVYQILHIYHYLLEQPLVGVGDKTQVLSSMTLGWLASDCQLEDAIVLSQIIGLIWYRGARENDWRSLADSWASRCPARVRKTIEDLKARLEVQTRLTSPSAKQPPIARQAIQDLPAHFPFAKLWAYLLYCDGTKLDETVIKMNGTTAPESHTA